MPSNDIPVLHILPRLSYPELLNHVLEAYHRKTPSLFVTECEPCITRGHRLLEGDLRTESPPLPIYVFQRGGGPTVHSPGQLLIFPVFSIKNTPLISWISLFLKWQKELLLSLKIPTPPLIQYEPQPGIWIENRKIGFAGLALKGRWLIHGFALNLQNDIELFQYIRPCHEDILVTNATLEGVSTDQIMQQSYTYIENTWPRIAIENV